jgi:hypothetical protein
MKVLGGGGMEKRSKEALRGTLFCDASATGAKRRHRLAPQQRADLHAPNTLTKLMARISAQLG